MRGQVEVATPGGVIASSARARTPAGLPGGGGAVRAADWVVIGPGSWFTSVIPHLLVPDLRRAIVADRRRAAAGRSTCAQPGETDGFIPADHLAVLARHAPGPRGSTSCWPT